MEGLVEVGYMLYIRRTIALKDENIMLHDTLKNNKFKTQSYEFMHAMAWVGGPLGVLEH